jgi:hypothetical protein
VRCRSGSRFSFGGCCVGYSCILLRVCMRATLQMFCLPFFGGNEQVNAASSYKSAIVGCKPRVAVMPKRSAASSVGKW